jgi:hypothetical protein
MSKMAVKLEKSVRRFVVALPREFSPFNVTGSVASNEGDAVRHVIFRKFKRDPIGARVLCAELGRKGIENYALEIPRKEYPEEKLEICYYLASRFGGNPRGYLSQASAVLNEFYKK